MMSKILLLITLTAYIFLSSCITGSKSEVKKSPLKEETKKVSESKEDKEDKKEQKSEEKEALQPEDKKTENISATKDIKNEENSEEEKEEEDKKENKLTLEDKKKINSELIKLKAEKPQNVVKKVDELLSEYPENPLLLFHKAKAYYSLDDLNNSLLYLEKSLKIKSDFLPALKLKYKILSKQNPQNVESYLLSLLREFPDNYKVILIVDRAYYDLKKYKKVIHLSKEVLKLNQNNKEALKFLALGYYYTNSMDLAYYVITKVDELMYQIPELYYIKGLILYKNKNIKGAYDSFTEAFDLDNNFFEAGDWKAYIDYKVGMKLKNKEEKKKKLEQAAQEYEKVIKLRKNALTYMNYALVLYELDRNDEALKYFLESEKLDNKNYMLYYNLGVLYLEKDIKGVDKIEKYDLAVKAFETYNKLLPKKDFKKLNANNLITEAKTQKAVEQAKLSAAAEEEKLKQEEKTNEDKEETDNEDKEDSDINKETDDKEEVNDNLKQNTQPEDKEEPQTEDKEEDKEDKEVENKKEDLKNSNNVDKKSDNIKDGENTVDEDEEK